MPADYCRPRLYGFLHSRLVGEAVSGKVYQYAAAYVLYDGQAVLIAKLHKLCHAYARGKAHHPEIAGVDLEQRHGVLVYCIFVIGKVGLVGGAKVYHHRPALGHNVWYPELAAYLHQLPPGYRHLAAPAEGGQGEHYGRRVVVYGHGRLCAGYFTEQLFKVGIPLPPRPGLKVVFEV